MPFENFSTKKQPSHIENKNNPIGFNPEYKKYLKQIIRNLVRKIKTLGTDPIDEDTLSKYREELQNIENTSKKRAGIEDNNRAININPIIKRSENFREEPYSIANDEKKVFTSPRKRDALYGNPTNFKIPDNVLQYTDSSDIIRRKKISNLLSNRLLHIKKAEKNEKTKKNNPLNQSSTKHTLSVWRNIQEKIKRMQDYNKNDIPFDPENFSQ